MIEPTISSAVMGLALSRFLRRFTKYQSAAKITRATILILAQRPTYLRIRNIGYVFLPIINLKLTHLYLNFSMSYSRHRPPFSPHVVFHRMHVESIRFPNKIGAGMYPNSLKMTNCMPRANARSSADTDRRTIISKGICVDATTKVMKKSRMRKG